MCSLFEQRDDGLDAPPVFSSEPELFAAKTPDRSTQGVDLATWCNDSCLSRCMPSTRIASSDGRRRAVRAACDRERNDRMRSRQSLRMALVRRIGQLRPTGDGKRGRKAGQKRDRYDINKMGSFGLCFGDATNGAVAPGGMVFHVLNRGVVR